MNGVRSTYMRKGYLLTALAAAVLLAASSGTAYAQSVGFSGTSGDDRGESIPRSSKTGAQSSSSTINMSGLNTDSSDKIPNNGDSGLGMLTLEHRR